MSSYATSVREEMERLSRELSRKLVAQANASAVANPPASGKRYYIVRSVGRRGVSFRRFHKI